MQAEREGVVRVASAGECMVVHGLESGEAVAVGVDVVAVRATGGVSMLGSLPNVFACPYLRSIDECVLVQLYILAGVFLPRLGNGTRCSAPVDQNS